MTIYLKLIVREADQSVELIDSYYDFHIERCQSAPVDLNSKIEYLEDERNHVIEQFKEDRDFGIYKQVPRMVSRADTYSETFDFMVKNNPNGYVRSDPDDLETLISYLRRIQAELKAEAPFDDDGYTITPIDVEFDFEYRAIPLCEFARDRGYGIDWEY